MRPTKTDLLSAAHAGAPNGRIAPPSRTITIVKLGSNDFTIHEGDRYLNRLTWEEALAVVIELTHPHIVRWCLQCGQANCDWATQCGRCGARK